MSVTLNTGASMPLIGLGTWQAPAGVVGAAVSTALQAGYRHIDCAACYGNESEIGEVLSSTFSTGSIKREDVFITSKLWNSEHKPEHVKAACVQTLSDLKLDYLDLYLIHWPQAFQKVEGTTRGFPRNAEGGIIYEFDSALANVWSEMEKLVESGLVKAIGLSNFNSKQIAKICDEGKIVPACLQIESHPFFQQDKLIDFCKEKKIQVTAYSPLGTGATIDGYTIATHPALTSLGAKSGSSAAQVAIGFQVARGIPTFPKSTNPERIKANLAAASIKFTEDDIVAVKALDKGIRGGWGGPKVERDGKMQPRDLLHPDYPFRPEIEF